VGGLGGAIVGSMNRSTDLINSTGGSRPSAARRSGGSKAKKAAPPEKPSVEIYRGTTSNSYKVGGYGR